MTAAFLMIGAMSGFAIADAFIRMASLSPGGGASAGQVLMIHSVMGVLIYGMLMLRTGGLPDASILRDRLVLLRSAGDAMGAACFVTALTLMPLGQASAILQFQPLVVTMGAALFLGERVGPFRWSAVVIGFAGVMLIVRPGTSGYDAAAFLVLGTVVSLAVRDLVTRRIAAVHSTMALAFLVSLLLGPTGLALHLFASDGRSIGDIGGEAFGLTIVSTFFTLAGYYAMTWALRIGEVSFIAPYRYSRLVAAFLAAWLMLGEKPGLMTLAGGAIVVLSGLVVILRERHLRRTGAVAGQPFAKDRANIRN